MQHVAKRSGLVATVDLAASAFEPSHPGQKVLRLETARTLRGAAVDFHDHDVGIDVHVNAELDFLAQAVLIGCG